MSQQHYNEEMNDIANINTNSASFDFLKNEPDIYDNNMTKTFTKTQIINMKKAITSLSRSKIYTLDNYIKLTRKRLK